MKKIASVIWDIGKDIEATYEHLFEVVRNADSYSKEELLKIIGDEAEDLKETYNNLAKEHGWI